MKHSARFMRTGIVLDVWQGDKKPACGVIRQAGFCLTGVLDCYRQAVSLGLSTKQGRLTILKKDAYLMPADVDWLAMECKI